MISRLGYQLLRGAGLGILALAVGVPLAGVLWQCVANGTVPAEGWSVSVRQWRLLGKTLGLAFCATSLAFLFAAPVALSLSRTGGSRLSRVLWGVTICPLLMSPMVLTFGWARIFAGLDWLSIGPGLCVLSWASWLWPVPAMLIGTGWAQSGRSAYEAALLDTGRRRAFRVCGIPALRGQILGAMMILLMVMCADYNVPHAASIQVYATELLSWATNYASPIHVLWVSVPLLGALTLFGLVAYPFVADRRRDTVADGSIRPSSTGSPWPGWLAAFLLVVIPQFGLLIRLESVGGFVALGRTYGVEILWNLVIATCGGLVGVLAGMASLLWGAVGRGLAAMLLLGGLVPGALLGKALASAYVSVPLIYDHWPILLLAYAGRFGWIGVVVWWAVGTRGTRVQEESARVGGAGPAEIFWEIRLARARPPMLGATLAVAGLCLADLATASQLALPCWPLLSMILVEKFHRFEEQMLVCISLTLQVIPVATAVLVAGIVSRRGRTR